MSSDVGDGGAAGGADSSGADRAASGADSVDSARKPLKVGAGEAVEDVER